jgi:heme exporter protein A
LDSVGLRPRANEAVRTFSRGMQQRLALARAMIGAPKVLLLDEPYTGLDDTSCRAMNGLLREFSTHGGCVLLSTHEFQRGLDGRNCILNLEQGKISKASVTT